jgi:hypothetical protein
MRSQSALQRSPDQKDQPPIFINHGDINININLSNPEKGLDHQNIKQHILKNIQEQIGESAGPPGLPHRNEIKPHVSAGGRRTQKFPVGPATGSFRLKQTGP